MSQLVDKTMATNSSHNDSDVIDIIVAVKQFAMLSAYWYNGMYHYLYNITVSVIYIYIYSINMSGNWVHRY